MDNNLQAEGQEKKVKYTFVTNMMCLSVCVTILLVMFLWAFRKFINNEQLMKGYLGLLVMIFLCFGLVGFFIIKRLNINIEKNDIILLISLTVLLDICGILLFCYAAPGLYYVGVFLTIVINVLIYIFAHIKAVTKAIISIVSVALLFFLSALSLTALPFTADYYYFTYGNTYKADTAYNENSHFYTDELSQFDYEFIAWKISDMYGSQVMSIKNTEDMEWFYSNIGVEQGIEGNVKRLFTAGKQYDDEFFANNTIFLCVVPLESRNDRINFNALNVAENTLVLDYTYYTEKNDTEINSEGICVAAITLNKNDAEKLSKVSYISTYDEGPSNGRRQTLAVD
ncbi:MAG TPA: hypothetical protein GX401_06050 [Clostridiales bacterium]|nr:hypothetical protein [Clostridiales bacterium]